MSDGWIVLHRKITDNDMWRSEKFTKAQAWIDMILLANFEDSMFFVRGNEVQVKRGQIAWSESKLGKRWKWSRDKVRRFLRWLKTRQQIIQHNSPILNIIEIVNYNEYQKTIQQTRQQKNNRKTHTKKDKESIKKDEYIDFVFLTQDEYGKLKERWGEDSLKERIKNMNDYAKQIGVDKFKKKYSSHFATLKNWARRNGDDFKQYQKPAAGKTFHCAKCNEDHPFTGEHSKCLQFMKELTKKHDDRKRKQL